MKFNKIAKEHVNDIIKYIVSLGGKKVCEAASGTIYCELTPIKKIRIADHLSSKGKTDYLHIIIQKEEKRYKYICILNRNILLLSNTGQVKQWIRDIQFVLNAFAINGFSLHYDDDKINSMKKDIVSKDCKLLNNKKEIERLNRIISVKNVQIEKYIDRYHSACEYHNKWQESQAQANKYHKQIEKLLHENYELKKKISINDYND